MKTGKKKYEAPNYEVVRFDAENIISTTSGCYVTTIYNGEGGECTIGDPVDWWQGRNG